MINKEYTTKFVSVTGNHRLFNALREAGMVAYCPCCDSPESCCVYHTIYVEIASTSDMNKFIKLQKEYKGECSSHRTDKQWQEYMDSRKANPARTKCHEEVLFEEYIQSMCGFWSRYMLERKND